MEKRKLPSVQYVHHVTQIEGADKIECVHVERFRLKTQNFGGQISQWFYAGID